MDLFRFSKLPLNELALAYNQLRKSIKAVFTGDVDPMINQLDIIKVRTKINSGKITSEQELALTEQLIKMKSALDRKKINIAVWNQITLTGAQPHTREGAAGCLALNKLFVFGGFSQDLWNDLR